MISARPGRPRIRAIPETTAEKKSFRRLFPMMNTCRLVSWIVKMLDIFFVEVEDSESQGHMQGSLAMNTAMARIHFCDECL
jgi:hypothetical protein